MDPIETQALALRALKPEQNIPQNLRTDGTPEGNAKLKQACEDFEAMFVKMMLDSMRKTVDKAGLLDTGMSGEMFEDLLYDEYSKVMAKSGSFGIADLLYSQLGNEPVSLKRASYR